MSVQCQTVNVMGQPATDQLQFPLCYKGYLIYKLDMTDPAFIAPETYKFTIQGYPGWDGDWFFYDLPYTKSQIDGLVQSGKVQAQC